jgi:hypothetical protein
MKKDFKYWLRWIAVLPGSITAGFLATFPLHWALGSLFSGEETDLGSIKFFVRLFVSGISYENIEYALSPFVIAITFILVGFELAPQHKFQTCMALTAIWTISFVSIFVFMPGSGAELRAIGGFLGLFSGLYFAWRKHKIGSTSSSLHAETEI